MNVNVKILLILAGLSGALPAAGQPPPIPFMWIPKGLDTTERNKFTQGGYPISTSLSKAAIFGLDQPTSYVYTTDAIDQLIRSIQSDNTNNTPQGDGVRLYFAAYDAANVPTDFSMGPTIKDKQVILLFCGSTGNVSADVPTYYVISPVDNQPHKILPTIWKDWCNYYYSNDDNASGLVSTLEPGHMQENQYNGTDFDTRSIYYDMAHFTEFLQTEQTYQDTCQSCNPTGEKIDGIGIYFAAYLNTGVGCNPYHEGITSLKDRLFVMFEFMRGPKVYYIEDALGFGSRTPSTDCQQQQEHLLVHPNKHRLQPQKMLAGGGNNGQLCPPNCPCLTGCP